MKNLICLLTLFSQLSWGGLTFNGATSDRVTCASTGTDPTTATVYAWVYPTACTTTRRVFSKTATGNTGYWSFNISGAGTCRIRVSIDYTTTDADAQSADNAIVINKWNFVAATFTPGTAPHVYVGTLTTTVAEVSYTGTPAVNAGTRVTDAGASVIIGNLDNSGVFSGAWPGDIDIINWIPGTALTLAELIAAQAMATVHANSKIFMGLGRTNGAGTQADLSGAGNNGTVTGAVLGVAGVPLGVSVFLGVF